MPFAVSQWPYSPDPRGANFDGPGWDYGQVPPWAWILETTNATGLAEVFNDGVRVEPFSQVPGGVTFTNVDVLPAGVTVILAHTTFQEPIPPPPGNTVFIAIVIFQLGLPQFSGTLDQLYPTAIEVQGPIAMMKVGLGVGTMPDPMETEPSKWNA